MPPKKKVKVEQSQLEESTGSPFGLPGEVGAPSRVVYSLRSLTESEHAAEATKHAATPLAEVPDDALAAECASRNLIILSGETDCSVETLIESRYVKNSLLGKGSSGTVYDVSPVSDLSGHFALKTMLKGGGNAEGYVNEDEDMAREVSFLKRLHHPCIGSCVEVFESPTAFHLVLEELKGGEVHDFLASHEHFSEDDAKHVTRHMLQGIQYLQQIGVVHRDIKVENVLLLEPSPTSAVKIADFGLATDVSGPHYNGHSASGIKACKTIEGEEYYGTLATMAPEVMTDGGCYGPNCDVYSAGCVVYTLLSGYYPFDAQSCDDFEAMVKSRATDNPAPVDYPEWEDVSDDAKAFLQFIMQHDPADRPTAAEALEHPWLGRDGGGCNKKEALPFKKNSKGAKHKNPRSVQHKGKHTRVEKKDHVCTTSM